MDWVKGTESNDESAAKRAVRAKLGLRTELLSWMAMYQRLVQASTVKASACSTARAGICFRAPCDLVFVVDTRGDEEKAAGLRGPACCRQAPPCATCRARRRQAGCLFLLRFHVSTSWCCWAEVAASSSVRSGPGMSKMIWVGSAFTSLAMAGRVRRSWLVM